MHTRRRRASGLERRTGGGTHHRNWLDLFAGALGGETVAAEVAFDDPDGGVGRGGAVGLGGKFSRDLEPDPGWKARPFGPAGSGAGYRGGAAALD